MVRYVQQRHSGDPNRVYVAGTSSGAMMTNVMLGALPGRLQGRRGLRRRALRLLRHHRRFHLEQPVRAGPDHPDRAAVGRPGPQRLPRLHRPAPADAAVARHARRDAALPQLRRRDQAVDQRARPEPDADVTDTPQSGWTRTRYGGSGPARRPSRRSACRACAQPAGERGGQAIRFFGLDTPAT